MDNLALLSGQLPKSPADRDPVIGIRRLSGPCLDQPAVFGIRSGVPAATQDRVALVSNRTAEIVSGRQDRFAMGE